MHHNGQSPQQGNFHHFHPQQQQQQHNSHILPPSSMSANSLPPPQPPPLPNPDPKSRWYAIYDYQVRMAFLLGLLSFEFILCTAVRRTRVRVHKG